MFNVDYCQLFQCSVYDWMHTPLNTRTISHTRTLTNTHTQSYFSAVYQIWAYSSLALSIYSGVHLGEPKLIEAHHNGLFISYWTDRPTPSLSLALLSHLFLTQQQIWREKLNQVGAGQHSPDYQGLKVICAPSKWIQNLVFSAPQADWFVSHLHTHIHSHIYTHRSTQALVYYQTAKLTLFHFTFILNPKLPFFPIFFLLLDIFQIFQLPHRTVIRSIALPSAPLTLCLPLQPFFPSLP